MVHRAASITARPQLSCRPLPPCCRAQEAAREDFQKRVASLQRLLCLPPLAEGAYARMAAAGRQRALDQLLLQGPGPLPAGAGQQQQEQQGGEAAGSGVGGEALARLSQGGVATWNADAYEARLRLLALCGWDLKVVAAGGGAEGATGGGAPGDNSAAASASSPAAAGQGSSQAGPECSALTCTLCGAKAGLWSFFPRCQPQVQAPALRGGRPAHLGGLPGGGECWAGLGGCF